MSKKTRHIKLTSGKGGLKRATKGTAKTILAASVVASFLRRHD